MGKKTPKIYDPGELTEVRENLGELSPDEARRMSKLLGGEVGTEKSEFDRQREKNLNLLEKPRRPVEVLPLDEPRRSSRSSRIRGPRIEKKENFPFMDRVRLDFLCTRREFGIKSISGAIGSLFSFLLPIPDKVNPRFIRSLEKTVMRPITELVRSVRRLFTKTKEDVFKEICTHNFYRSILQIIKDWDMDALEREYANLKKNIRDKNCTSLIRFCVYVYIPIMRLSQLDEKGHILGALKWAYQVNVDEAKDNLMEKDRIISTFYQGEKVIPKVFDDVKRILYPILLKNISHSFYYYEEFFSREIRNILTFLQIKEENIILPPQPLPHSAKQELRSPAPIPEKQSEEKPENDRELKNEEEFTDTEEDKNIIPSQVIKGCQYLERLYPRGGWRRLEEFPDFYPYFQPLFHYPSGFELIPPHDPLHQVVFLLSIINDLFYGFRHIKFGFIHDRGQKQEMLNVQDKVDRFIGVWPLYIDEVISKAYNSRLQDYCRHIEKERAFKKSEVAGKIISELDWLKKHYILPHWTISTPNRGIGIIKRKVPKLFDVVSEFRNLLSRVVKEIKEKGKDEKSGCVSNPWMKYLFDVENSTASQLDKILVTKARREDGKIQVTDRRNNANLLYYTLAALNVLNYLINNPESHLYHSNSTKIFRSVHENSDIPQYTVNTINPFMIMEDLQNPDKGVEEIPEKELPLHRIIERRAEKLKKNNVSFAVLYIKIKEFKDDDSLTEEDVIKTQIDLSKDLIIAGTDQDYTLILEGRNFNGLLELIRSLNRVFPEAPILPGLIQYQPSWRSDYFIKVLDKVKEFAAALEPGKMIFLDVQSNKFKRISITLP